MMTMPETPLITSRDPIGLQCARLMDAVYDGAHLNASEALNVSERGGELKRGLRMLFDRLKKPRPENYLIGNRYQQKRTEIDFMVSAENIRDISSIMKSRMRGYIHDHQGCPPDMIFSPILTPEVYVSDFSVAESIFIGFMIIADASRYHSAIITKVDKIDEHPDSQVFFKVSVTVSEFSR